MILTSVDGKTQIRNDETGRMVGVYNPALGEVGAIEIKRANETCVVDIGAILRANGFGELLDEISVKLQFDKGE